MQLRKFRQLAFVFGVGMLLGVLVCAAQTLKDSNGTQEIGFALVRTQGPGGPHLSRASVNASGRRLDELIEEKDYSEFERELPSAKLSKNDRFYFEGILADRLNQPSHAIVLLGRVLPELMKSNRKRAAIALNALAADDFMVGRYSDATAEYAELLQHFASFLDPDERRGVQDNHDTMALLGNAAPQSISGEHSFRVSTRRDRLGDLDVPIRIGADTEWWLFDTGANISDITRTTAKRLGLNLSKGRAQTQGGATGAEVPLSTAIIPEIAFGRAVIHNVVVLVMDDKDLNIDLGDQRHYQIDAILGYPVLAALQSFTVTGTEMEISPSSTPSARSTRLYVDELTPLIAANTGRESLIFQFDTGNTGADLTARFFKRFPQRFASLKSEQGRFGGAGGANAVAVYRLPQLELRLGSATANLKNITLFAGNRGELLDKLYGNLGQELLRQFRSYTIDFTRMQLTLGDSAAR
jgi:predicted aspartyl protease